ncbi:MAG: type II toxin-antitoxin system VapC family toxin, partial [Trebonia sp.]
WQVTRLRSAIVAREAMVVDAVRLEVLAGLHPSAPVTRLRALLDGCEDVMQLHRVDAEEGARIYRTCRGFGETIRAHADCLIAAIAIRNDVPVLHRDRDYDVIARHFPLKVVQP